MTKRVFNRFDPFMPIKIDNNMKMRTNSVENAKEEIFDGLSNTSLTECIKFRTPHIKSGFTIILSKKAIGNENGLGEKLLEDFIYSLSNSFELPQHLIFMNEAVHLLQNERVENSLFQLKKYGVKNLVSIESLNYFNCTVNNKLFIQATSGDITEKMLFSTELINL